MKKLLIFQLLFSAFSLQAQTYDLSVIRSVADNILNEHSYNIVDKKTGKVYSDSKELPSTGDFIPADPVHKAHISCTWLC